MAISRMNYPGLIAPAGPYVHAVKHHHLLYLSGITAYGTSAQNEAIDQQAIAIFEQISHIAEAEGSDLSKLITVTVYVTELSRIQQLRDSLFAIYAEHLPASTLVEVPALFMPELKIEVTATLGLHEA